jgi:DNA-binding IclR family transcriptional regulator
VADTSYKQAQIAIANLKSAIREVLLNAGAKGMTNAEIGRTLGIYTGHKGHEGHIPRTMLAIMENEGVVAQDEETNRWSLRSHSE